MSPAQKKRAKELFPEFYSQRKRLLKQQTKNVFRLAKLKLEGPENEKDLMTQYLAESGRLDVGPLNNILNPETSQSTDPALQRARFQRGLLSPFRIFGDEAVGVDGTSQIAIRKGEESEYAQRDYSSGNFYRANMGMVSGFPPTDSAAQNQGDAVWWRVLQNANSAPQ